MDFKEENIQIDGTRIHYVTCGSGPPIVLVHGLTNNWKGYVPLASFLGKTNTLYIPDLPGYGDSGQLPHYSVEIMSKYVQKFVRAIGVEQPVPIMGLSMGGFIVADFTKTYPDLVSRLVVMGPVLQDCKRKGDIVMHMLMGIDRIPGGRFILKKIIETRTYGYLSSKYINMYKVNMPLIDLYGSVGRKKMTKDVYMEMFTAAHAYDLEETLSGVRVPTLLLYGREDRISGPARAEQHLLARNNNLSLGVIPQAGHVVCFEKAEESAMAIVSFLSYGNAFTLKPRFVQERQ